MNLPGIELKWVSLQTTILDESAFAGVSLTQQIVPARVRVMECTAVAAAFIYILSNGQELRDHFEGRARWMDTRRRARKRNGALLRRGRDPSDHAPR